MNILFLERKSVDPDGIDLSPIERLGNVRYLESSDRGEQIRAAADADALIINKTVLTRDYLAACPNLKCVCLLATGYNNVDLDAARDLGIAVCNVPGYSTDAVAQLTFSFILNFATNMIPYSESVKNGDWTRCDSYTYYGWDIRELTGKSVGIVGFGSIGKRVGALAHAFGMRVLAHTRTVPADLSGIPYPVSFLPLDELLKESDFVTLHCPLTEKTRSLINRETLAHMKKTAFLINTSRGAVVDEQALADALNEGRIAGAGIDVLDPEPMRPDCPYLNAKHILVTPHIAWAAREARERLIGEVAENLKSFREGGRRNRVDLLGI
ncbi:MAG: D-2-hydroxyacid dehydrogenase [Clostridia bacterium]|nr:D-2-hydroxyacid dehydrogenase [Clostridia bacterium]